VDSKRSGAKVGRLYLLAGEVREPEKGMIPFFDSVPMSTTINDRIYYFQFKNKSVR
jgi:hypothetical protein